MEVVIILVIFGSITAWIGLGQRHVRELKRLELETRPLPPGSSAPGQPGKHAVPAVPAALPPAAEERLRHLEDIVCSVDFELNQKLNRLALASAITSPPSADGTRPSAGSSDAQTLSVEAQTQKLILGGLEPGKRLADRFVVEQAIGVGGMGAVYRARDEKLGELVAVKVVAGHALLDPQAAERLRREAAAARRISHPNVVRLHDLGEERGIFFLSMELVQGPSLKDVLTRQGRLPVASVRSLALQLLDGLGAAHQQGVVHRDLKPANVLLDATQQVKIIDFGLARLPHLEGMTTTGMILGTPEYMAPEQIRGKGPVDHRADLYAVGAVLHHCLAGSPPFSGENPIATSLAQLVDPPPPLRSLVPDVPPEWEAMVLRALEKDPNRRFSSAQEMRAIVAAL